jgi:hypothetical protein
MQGAKRITRHAWDRWLERFDEFDINAELAKAIPWGGQRHGDESLLAPCGAVFIVSGSNVRTVLTRTQALANMQQFVRGALFDELAASARMVEEPIVYDEPFEEALDEGNEESTTRLQELGKDHANRLSWKCKQRKTEFREAGFDPTDPAQMEIYRDAYFAERRRLLGTATSKAST